MKVKMRAGLTVAQVGRRACFRCRRRRGHAQWSVCADGNRARVLCWPCDRALNRLVLRWARDSQWREKCARYDAAHDRRAA